MINFMKDEFGIFRPIKAHFKYQLHLCSHKISLNLSTEKGIKNREIKRDVCFSRERQKFHFGRLPFGVCAPN